MTHPDGSYEEYHDGKKTDSGGALKLVDQENYTGNIPREFKNFMNYLLEQARAMKPPTGGETELTDGGVVGTVIQGPVDTVLTRHGGVLGLLGNPGTVDREQVAPGGNVGNITPGTQNGAIDYGPDSDKTGWTGPVHQDDPGDVQFGPQAPVDQGAVSSKDEDEEKNQTSSLFDFLRRNVTKSSEE